MEAVLVDSRLRAHPAVAPLWQRAVDAGRAAEVASRTLELRVVDASESSGEEGA